MLSPLCAGGHTHTHTHIHTHMHTHTHTCTHTLSLSLSKYMDYWRWVGTIIRKKTTEQYVEEKKWLFRFDLKEVSEDECLTE